jgi:hypothetical protein
MSISSDPTGSLSCALALNPTAAFRARSGQLNLTQTGDRGSERGRSQAVALKNM